MTTFACILSYWHSSWEIITYAWFPSWTISLMFLCTFKVLSPKFKIELFWIIFLCKRSDKSLDSPLCMQITRVPSTVCWKECPFPKRCFCYICWKSVCQKCIYFWMLCSVLLTLFCLCGVFCFCMNLNISVFPCAVQCWLMDLLYNAFVMQRHNPAIWNSFVPFMVKWYLIKWNIFPMPIDVVMYFLHLILFMSCPMLTVKYIFNVPLTWFKSILLRNNTFILLRVSGTSYFFGYIFFRFY